MLQSLRDLQDYTILAQDGDEFGKIVDFIFDDFNWLVRYLVLRMGERDVVLSRHAFGTPDVNRKVLPLVIDRVAVIDSPDVNLGEPFGREQEIVLHHHYGWSPYWQEDEIPESLPGDLTAIPLAEMEMDKEPMIPVTNEDELDEQAESHLHSANEVMGYQIIANDGSAGTLSDFIIQVEDWDLHYLVVEAGNMFVGRKVLVSPQWVTVIQWDEDQVYVNLNKETIHNSPIFNSANGLTPEYWDQVTDYYGHGT